MSLFNSHVTTIRYIKNQHRSRLCDELTSATLHLQQLKVLVEDETLLPTDKMVLEFKRALSHVENNLTQLREKYLDARVLKDFDDGTGRVRGYEGHVDCINWSRSEGSFLFHVVYDSDSDEEDMELW